MAKHCKRYAVHALIAACLLVAGGCGGTENEDAEPVTQDTVTERNPTDGSASSAEESQRPSRKDRQRAREIMAYYRESGAKDRWLIDRVKVSGGDVVVETCIYPDSGGEGAFTGACTVLTDWEPWTERISVVGQDGLEHAAWSKGDIACETFGL